MHKTVIVGVIAGWATGKIMRGSAYGPFVDILIGTAGAIVGGWIMRGIGFQGQTRHCSFTVLSEALIWMIWVFPIGLFGADVRACGRRKS